VCVAGSVGYTVETLQFGWLQNPVDIDENLENSQFTLVNHKYHDCQQNYTAGSSLYAISIRIYLLPRDAL